MQAVLRIHSLPEAPLDASAAFHAEKLEEAREMLDGAIESLALVFPTASHDHLTWREAVVAGLARESAPVRVNGVAGDDADAIEASLAWLERAPGITGQLLAVDGTGAGIPA